MSNQFNLNVVIPTTVKDLRKTLESIRETMKDFPEFSVSVSAPSAMRSASPIVNAMRTPEENSLRDAFNASADNQELRGGKNFRLTDWMATEYGNALDALRAWKAGEWTIADSMAKQAAKLGKVKGETPTRDTSEDDCETVLD